MIKNPVTFAFILLVHYNDNPYPKLSLIYVLFINSLMGIFFNVLYSLWFSTMSQVQFCFPFKVQYENLCCRVKEVQYCT